MPIVRNAKDLDAAGQTDPSTWMPILKQNAQNFAILRLLAYVLAGVIIYLVARKLWAMFLSGGRSNSGGSTVKPSLSTNRLSAMKSLAQVL